MSNSVGPHGLQPSRLPRPWDSPGKNTGVGCHFLLQCMKVKSESEVAQSCQTLHDPMDCSLPGSSIHGIFQARVLERGVITFSARTPEGPLNDFFIAFAMLSCNYTFPCLYALPDLFWRQSLAHTCFLKKYSVLGNFIQLICV